MPNAIELAMQFIPVLDEVYKMASLTADLDGAAELAKEKLTEKGYRAFLCRPMNAI